MSDDRKLVWQQARASDHSLVGGCVQVAVDWAGTEGKSPLEVGVSDDCGLVLVRLRDSHDTDVVVKVPREPDWRFFIEAVKAGEFDGTLAR